MYKCPYCGSKRVFRYRAQWEIHELADRMLVECKKVAPNLFLDAGPKCMFSSCQEGPMSCGKAKEVREKYKAL